MKEYEIKKTLLKRDDNKKNKELRKQMMMIIQDYQNSYKIQS